MTVTDVRNEPTPQSETTNAADVVRPEELNDLSMAQLRRLWRDRVGKKDPPRIRSMLLRELAWHDQQTVQGGMDAQTRALLQSAVTQANNTTARPGTRPRNTSSKPSRPKLDLQPGTRLIRTWRGKQYEVIVRDKDTPGGGGGGRFEYNGQTYRGLTAITEKITGAHWSGPRFFGLNRVRSAR
jgi:Protein of unknown function (DUF2924)